MELKGKKFLVYGAGVSGISAYEFLKRNNANVYLYSDKTIENCNDVNTLNKFSEVFG